MNTEKMKQLMEQYYWKIRTTDGFDIARDIPKKRLDNAIKSFASGIDPNTVIGFYDTTITASGKMGYLFTDTKVCWKDSFEKPHKLWYDDIKSVELFNTSKPNDCNRSIKFHLYDGTTIEWNNIFLNKTPLYNFFVCVLALVQENSVGSYDDLKTKHKTITHYGVEAAGITKANVGTINKLYNEEKFHASRGHGYAAERANNLYDNLHGHDARVLGDDNAKNGADRIVDGVQIQSKYCANGYRCIKECFDKNGNFRYYVNGEPMQIEVPSDMYNEAVQAMEKRIRNGQVRGVTDTAEAKNIVRKGHYTYKQARNIAKAGNVDSIVYDATTEAVIATSAMGISAVITFATSIWNGEDFDIALKSSVYSGLRVGGTAFVTGVLASQISKAGLNSSLVGSSEAIANLIGPKASAFIINAFRSGNNIYGAAAMKSMAKLLRGNVITGGITIIVLSAFDIANIFRGRISAKQLMKTLTITASSVAGGSVGWIAGSAIGSILPGPGTVIGGVIGALVAGVLAGKGSDKLMGTFIEDDAEQMLQIIQDEFTRLAEEYLLSRKEAEKAVDKLQDELSGNVLKLMFASDDRNAFARTMLTPIVENETYKRKDISMPSDEQLNLSLQKVLEAMADDEKVNDENKEI